MNDNFSGIEKLYRRISSEVASEDERCGYFLKIYNDLVSLLSDASALHFNTPFARVSYISSRYRLNKAWSYAMQIPRRELKQRKLDASELLPIVKAAIEYLLSLYKTEISKEHTDKAIFPALPKLPAARSAGRFKKKFARVVAISSDPEKQVLTILDEDEPDKTCYLHYGVEGVNDIFADTLHLAIREIGLPLMLGLVDIDCTEDDQYIPGYIIILPDLLLDVTSIAGAWTEGADPLPVNLIELFLPSESNEAILTGHVANFFLDELIRDTTLTYNELFTKSFKLYPIEFVQMSDDTLRGMYDNMQSHFENIQKAIIERFPAVGIDRKDCVIEPSYFSPQYGIKGRLDVYFQHQNDEGASIIELKSGKPFKPNSYGLSESNYHQTLLYELLIKSVHGPKNHRANFILYSSMAVDPLRFAVSVESLQKETIHKRNELVILQFRLLALQNEESKDIFNLIDPDRYPQLKGFIQRNIRKWHEVYAALSSGERSYFKAFAAYITREHMLARIGNDRGDGTGGLAGLWLDSIDTKEERFQIITGLKLKHIQQTVHNTLVTFSRTHHTNPLANFRAGDIAIMYPFEETKQNDPTHYQLHRANILSVDSEEIVIKLRNIQVNTSQISQTKYWNIEHDLLDSSFRALYQSLWAFISSDIHTRQRIFGLTKPPEASHYQQWSVPAGLTTAQMNIYHEAINAGPIYLLWGPPGTGKTSMMLKSWVWNYYFNTGARIALLAYTNKAVDEISDAIESLGEEVAQHYIRIGSSAGTGEKYRGRLLDAVIGPMNKRMEIKNLLEQTRIYVATVASMHGKNDLFKLIDFDVAIIDEASQILEPAMVGLLTRFRKTILIGDHMQLPAVSTQPIEQSAISVENEWAHRIGLTDKGMSYFERIYRLYHAKGWHHMIGALYEQGRMAAEIQAFSNTYVYDQQLNCIDPEWQEKKLPQLIGSHENPLFHHRIIYIPSKGMLEESYSKTNLHEARIVLDVISHWQQLIVAQKLDWTIGVITPFRAQIATIQHMAYQSNVNMHRVTVDTVERYQGSARDIIIMSCAVNEVSQLNRIMSLNMEGVDRKLNVAITRARQQFILTGCESVLETQHAYRALISMAVRYQAVEYIPQ